MERKLDILAAEELLVVFVSLETPRIHFSLSGGLMKKGGKAFDAKKDMPPTLLISSFHDKDATACRIVKHVGQRDEGRRKENL